MPMMTREAALECAAFLQHLRRTANVKLSAELAGVPVGRLRLRRRRFPDFAQEWEAALVFARAALARREAARGAAAFSAPEAPAGTSSDGQGSDGQGPDGQGPDGQGSDGQGGAALLARGGELAVRAGGRRGPQVRRARAGDLTGEGVRRFLAHLAATANVSLSAAAVGVTKVAIYNRARRSSVFAEEMQRALEQGFERVDMALAATACQSLTPDGADVTDWLADSLAIEPLAAMTVDQALSALAIHRRTVLTRVPRKSAQRRPVPEEETNAALMRALARAEKRMRRDGAARG